MSAPNPYLGTSEDFDPALHWGPASSTGEKIAGRDPAGANFFSKSTGEASLVGIIDSARARGFLRYCLGYNNQTTAPTYTLQRTNPICHPRFTGLYCSSVALEDFAPVRASAPRLKIPQNDDGTGFVCSTLAGTGSTPRSLGFYAGYKKSLATIRFSPAPYRFLADDAGLKEYQRNTIIDTEPRTEVLTLSGFQLIFAEGDANTPPTSDPKTKPVPTEVGQVLIKPDVVVRFHDVPEKFISTNSIPGQMFPAKILRCLGKLNKTAWLSYPKGTLLLAGVRFARKPWALAAGLTTLAESIFNYDIEYLMTYFNPTKGNSSDVQITNADTFGHNCLPWRGDTPGVTLGGTDQNQARWFFATYSGNLSGIGTDTGDRGQYSYYEYDNLFDSILNPDVP